MNIKIENTGELALLKKMVGYVKFVAIDDEAAFMSGSPLINSLSDKVDNALKDARSQKSNITQEMLLKNRERIKNVVLSKLSNHPGWNNIEIDSKSELVRNMIYPFELTENEIDDMISKTDSTL